MKTMLLTESVPFYIFNLRIAPNIAHVLFLVKQAQMNLVHFVIMETRLAFKNSILHGSYWQIKIPNISKQTIF